MALLKNPVLTGFHPDPCLCKAEDTYYLITSTFEWVPGITVYESKDMVNWKRHGAILMDLDLQGIPDSAGIWAPAISYDKGIFYVVYTISKQIDGMFKDVENYVVRSASIDGPWSKPVLLNASGFDPSMFHENGRHYVLNPQWDPRPLPGHQKFNGLVLQEFDFERGMIGESKVIFKGSGTGGTEGPHLMKKDGYYYILAAEGGTGRHHSICVARSKDLWGPYEVSPYHPLITSWEKDTQIKKSGHGNLVEGPDGWYLCHLCARYLDDHAVCVLGRETALEKVEWVDGWPRMIQKDNAPLAAIEVEPEITMVPQNPVYRTDFKHMDLVKDGWLSLRTPFEDKIEWSSNGLVLRGGDSPSSLFNQSLIARRVTSFDWKARTKVDFDPYHYNHLAGLVCYYNTKVFHGLYVTYDEVRKQKMIKILCNDNQNFQEPLGEGGLAVPKDTESILLGVEVHQDQLQFTCQFDQSDVIPVGPVLDFSILSDEHAQGWAYTGATIALSVVDTFNKDRMACFAWFEQEDLQVKSSNLENGKLAEFEADWTSKKVGGSGS